MASPVSRVSDSPDTHIPPHDSEDKSMRTTIELDDDLMQTALELSGIQSEQALIEKAIKDLIKNYQAVLCHPNEQTKAAMLDVRAKKNLENITLEQRDKAQHNFMNSRNVIRIISAREATQSERKAYEQK